MKRAEYWSTGLDGKVQCRLCPHECSIGAGKRGLCLVRSNRDGVLYADGYGLISSSHIDPIEKKPLYHYRPGSTIFSIGGWGCNLRCSFCQNWSISQKPALSGFACSPGQMVDAARASGCSAIAYTYNEPLISIEYLCECASLAHDAGLQNVAVTNGYIAKEPGRAVIDVMDAFNVDIKSMGDDFYSRNCGGTLEPVLGFCRMVGQAGRHIEVTNLVIPGENDSISNFVTLAEWVALNLGRHVPLHFSAYRPEYKMANPATGVQVLRSAYDSAREYLDYVYLGNVPAGNCGQDTLCPVCAKRLIARSGYAAEICGVNRGVCLSCGCELKGFCW